MATIRPIEGRSVHQIQSGQVIVDLCSVVKELVENSLDARSSSIEVKFKNNGLDAIEVQDNGTGIAPDDFESLALKHYTSKLSSYNDLDSLHTFGFRGEALSSLCALSKLSVTTARVEDGAKGTRLEFETSGKLKSNAIVAATKGTSILVEDIFKGLPVRRKELERNIKREYGKVLALLHAYACISTGVRFAVSNQTTKAKKSLVFSTNSNKTTRENIANVYGAKTLLALVPLELKLELSFSTSSSTSLRHKSGSDDNSRDVFIEGHISRPVVGEGRQTPDRQMFFVNSRPCLLPQIAKAMNEVYKAYNVTQSPFIFANIKMDTTGYDVNVSPDKRTILLHDQTALLQALKSSLVEVFEAHDQTVPQSDISASKLPAYKPLTIVHGAEERSESSVRDVSMSGDTPAPQHEARRESLMSSAEPSQDSQNDLPPSSLLRKFVSRGTSDRQSIVQFEKPRKTSPPTLKSIGFVPASEVMEGQDSEAETGSSFSRERSMSKLAREFGKRIEVEKGTLLPDTAIEVVDRGSELSNKEGNEPLESMPRPIPDNERIPSTQASTVKKIPGVVQNAFDRMRPKRTPLGTATVTIGDKTILTSIGPPAWKRRRLDSPDLEPISNSPSPSQPTILDAFRASAAPRTNVRSSSEGLEVEYESEEGANIKLSKVKFSRASSPLKQPNTEGESSGESEKEEGSIAAEQSGNESDDEYIDEAEKKKREEARVAEMIAKAEEAAARPTDENLKRASSVLQKRHRKDATLRLVQSLQTSVKSIADLLEKHRHTPEEGDRLKSGEQSREEESIETAEEKLSLSVSKPDFFRMRIVGQFNRGFILAVRPGISESRSTGLSSQSTSDELFIIDQHASDEKYNFERLQMETIVQNQRLVRPKVLDLTAIEEEIIINHPEALIKNGFSIETDTSGDTRVGRRCSLVSLPMSREVVFDIRDLEELLALLGDGAVSDVPRPSKVRKMFAMRACRSSIMVGKPLTIGQMEKVVKHMGELDKPWNCPHGRPTMRHVFGLDNWEAWEEGDGLVGMEEWFRGTKVDWAEYVKQVRASVRMEYEKDEDRDKDGAEDEGSLASE